MGGAVVGVADAAVVIVGGALVAEGVEVAVAFVVGDALAVAAAAVADAVADAGADGVADAVADGGGGGVAVGGAVVVGVGVGVCVGVPACASAVAWEAGSASPVTSAKGFAFELQPAESGKAMARNKVKHARVIVRTSGTVRDRLAGCSRARVCRMSIRAAHRKKARLFGEPLRWLRSGHWPVTRGWHPRERHRHPCWLRTSADADGWRCACESPGGWPARRVP